LSVTGAPGFVVSLSWTGSSGADGYRIIRNGRIIDTSSRTSYVDRTASGPARFTYVVEAFGPGGTSRSNARTIVVPGEDDPIAVIRKPRGDVAVNAVGIARLVVACSPFVFACAGRVTLRAARRRIAAARFALRGGRSRSAALLLSEGGFTLLVERGRLPALATATTNSGVSPRNPFSRRVMLKAPKSGTRA
jgi:hypothetical protein